MRPGRTGPITASLLAILLVVTSCVASACAARCERSNSTPGCHTAAHQHPLSTDATIAGMERMAGETTSASATPIVNAGLCRIHTCAQQRSAANTGADTRPSRIVTTATALPKAASPLTAVRPRISLPETPPPGTLLSFPRHTILRV